MQYGLVLHKRIELKINNGYIINRSKFYHSAFIESDEAPQINTKLNLII